MKENSSFLIIGIVLGVFMCRYIFPIFGKMIIDAAKHLDLLQKNKRN